MSNAALARAGYTRSTKSTGSPRAIEIQLFSRFTAALSAAEERRETHHPDYVKALSDNLRLWTALGGAVAGRANGLPQELRVQIFDLFKFTREHTRKLMAGDSELTSDPLIEINRNIIAGLRSAPSESL